MTQKTGASHQEYFLEPGRAKRYAREAETWAGLMFGDFLKRIDALQISGRYLEIGPGPGVLAAMIARRRPDVSITGLDISPEMVEIARRGAAEKGLEDRVRFLVGDGGDESRLRELGEFDLVYSTYSMHHWKDAKQTVTALLGVLKKGGALLIHDFRPVWWLYYLPFNGGHWESLRASLKPSEIRAMLEELGVERYEVKNEFPFAQTTIVRK